MGPSGYVVLCLKKETEPASEMTRFLKKKLDGQHPPQKKIEREREDWVS